MAYRTVEATRRRAIKKIGRYEERQRYLIDRLVYDDLTEKKKTQIVKRIRVCSRVIEHLKNVILYEKREKH